jgi:hypothetical protein
VIWDVKERKERLPDTQKFRLPRLLELQIFRLPEDFGASSTLDFEGLAGGWFRFPSKLETIDTLEYIRCPCLLVPLTL